MRATRTRPRAKGATWLRGARASVALYLFAGARGAAAQDFGWLEVERHAGADACPDTAELRRSVEQLLATAPAATTPLIRVEFQAQGPLLSARLTRIGDEAATARELRDTHADCETLAQAVSTSVALMLETTVTLPANEPEPASEPVPTLVPVPKPTQDPANRLGLEIAGGMALDVIDDTSPFLSAAGVFERDLLRVGLGVAWVPRERITLGPGEVIASALMINSLGCLRVLDFSDAKLWGCTGLQAGILAARAQGYTSDSHSSKVWFAVPVEVSLSAPVSRAENVEVDARLGFTLLAPINRRSYSVQGLGMAVEPGRVQGVAWLGLAAFSHW